MMDRTPMSSATGSSSFATGAEPSIGESDADVLNLLMQVRQELGQMQEDNELDAKARQEFTDGCLQLCNLGCDPEDKLCITKQCNFLCQLNVPDRISELSLLSAGDKQRSATPAKVSQGKPESETRLAMTEEKQGSTQAKISEQDKLFLEKTM